METEKLYYQDGHCASFEAEVLECRSSGALWDIVLDRTAFYPEGGGQPADRGTLARLDVLDVQEENGVILHRLEEPLTPGSRVRGQVDLARRIDYTQQHSADHILSGVIHRRYGCENVGFHMGAESTMIDFDGPLTESDLTEMERVANEAVWMDLPVEISWPEPAVLRTMDYRSKKELTGAVRIVTIPGVDVCACCGTHVRRTGEVGMIKIISVAKLRGGVRVEYVAGRRAYAYLDELQLQNHLVSVSLSEQPLHTSEAVRRLLEERDAMCRRAAELEQKWIRGLAEQCRSAGNVLLFEEGVSGDALRRLADALKETSGGLVLVLSGSDEMGYQYAAAVQAGGDIRKQIQQMNTALNGRGGGREAHFAQGSLRALRGEIEAWWKARPADGSTV